jgi:hypothetical protein
MSKMNDIGAYDLIWVGSVFTHITAEGFRRMFSYLISHLCKDGLLVFTTHGRAALWVIEKHRLNRSHMSNEAFFAMKEQFKTNGYGFTPYAPGLVKHLVEKQGAQVSAGAYGFSCCRPDWVCRLIGEYPEVTLVSYQEGGWGKNHDVIAVQRPADLRIV